MTHKKRIFGLFILAISMMVATTLYGKPERNTDKTLSPYFLVKSHDPDVDQLPLKSTQARVNISGVIADIKVTQVYKNEGNKPLEAIYVFPASTRAAVYGMKMTIGERTITAKIRKREQARREYEQAKQAGKRASLLEQHRPNVFQMNVANILPGDIIKVELKYTELLVPRDAVYEFMYPTVVGPRYVDKESNESGSSDEWTANPYLHEGDPPTYTFDIAVDIAAGLPIQDITCPSHKTLINYRGTNFASVSLDQSKKHEGNRDFILKYRLAGGKIGTGLLLFEGKDENFFLLMLQPPKKVVKSQIPPREYIFIVDVSGSMHGFPLNISKKLLKDLISKLRPADKFNVLLFAGGSKLMSKRSLPATTENIKRAVNLIEQQRGGGGTRLLPVLKRALSLPKTQENSRSIIIVTDGFVSVEEEAFDLIRNNLGHANMFTFGIGSSVNRHLIEGMARVGIGEPFVITSPEEAPKMADRFRKLIESPVLAGIKIDFGGFEIYDVEPLNIPDVFSDRPVIVFGKWRGRPRGGISLQGFTGDRMFVKKVDVSKVRPLKTNSALRYLWARHRIGLLSDYNRLKLKDERVKEVTTLGLSYNLLTAYTSFIAVDTHIRIKDGKAVTVKQPLPLPQGVSDYALGKGCATAPMRMSMKKKVKESSTYVRNNMELREVTVTGGLSKESVQRMLKKHIRSLNLCYIKALAKGFNLKGEVVFKIVIDQAGNVVKAYMDKGEKRDKRFEKCMVQKIKKLNFPVSKGDEKALITVTFVLK